MSDGQKHELTVLVQVQTAIFDNTREQYRVGNKIQTWQQIAEQITAKGNGSKWRGKQVKQWTHFNSMSFIQKFVEQTEKNLCFNLQISTSWYFRSFKCSSLFYDKKF